jgi:adenylate cyclase
MQRKLAAILSADVVGYSRLMEGDEAGTLARLKDNRARIFDPRVANFGGRIFKLMGDGALAEFPSVIAAVECALAIQDETARSETNLPEPRRIRYRIGINLGEVILQDDDIYGEGVNVAARIQALAPVGGVALSKIVRDSVDGKMVCSFEDMGEHAVKNIERPVHVFSVKSAEGSAAPAMSTDQIHKLSVCVLPFVNMSGDAEQEYFSDGISEDIITDLSKVSSLFVIARNTAFTYKGRNVDVAQLARQLRVSHVLEGSVRKSGGRVRITAQLIDGATGGHVWAERYDRDLNDIFALQDEISQAIVKALKLKLLPEEKKAIEQRGTTNLDAYNLYLMARQYVVTGNLGDARRSEAIIRLCRHAIEIDPDYARAWALIAVAQVHLRFYAGSEGETGLEAAERALSLDANLPEAHAAKAIVLTFKADHEGAFAEINAALRLDPESYDANIAAGRLYYSLRKFEDAIRHLEKTAEAMDKDYWAPGMLMSCYKAIGDRDAVRRAASLTLARTEKIVAQDPNNGSAMGFAVGALGCLGEPERAREWATRAVLLDPDNLNMRYNLGCTLLTDANDHDGALALLAPLFKRVSRELFNWSKSDGDLDSIRGDPRFKAMEAEADARLTAEGK